MAKSREELDNIVEQMIEMIGIEETLDDLTKAMSTKELQENLEHIDNMRDLNIM